MSTNYPIQSNFTSGVISPLMMGHVDFEKVVNSAAELENMICMPQGGVTRRPGTAYVASTKTPSRRSLLVPFIFSTAQAYVLEFGHQYIRVFKDRGYVSNCTNLLTNGNFDSSIAGWSNDGTGKTFWNSAEKCANLDAVGYTGAGGRDYLYLSQAVSLTAGTYTYSFDVTSKTPDCRDYVLIGSSIHGSDLGINLIASTGGNSFTFTIPSTTVCWIEFRSLFDVTPYPFPTPLGIDNVGLGPLSAPVEITTTYDESELSSLQFCQSADELYIVHPAHKPAKLTRTSHTSWTLADITFTAAPADWTTGNYPGSISFFEQRLCFSGVPSTPRTIYCSTSGSFFDFTVPSTLVADSPVTVRATDNEVNAIRWMYPRTTLMCGTSSGIGTLGSTTELAAMNYANVKFNNTSADRAGTIIPKRAGSALICTDYYNKHITAISNDATGEVSSESLMLLAGHLVSNATIVDFAFQRIPNPILWCVTSDGRMLSLTFMPSQSIYAWTEHTTDGLFESVCVIPSSASSPDDEVWTVVNRTINGSTARYVELFYPQFDINNEYELADMVFLDSCLTGTFATPTTAISGLSHLEGQSVYALADGLVQGPFTVTSGAITLTTAASKAIVGKAFESHIKTIDFERQSQLGTAEGKLRRITEAALRLYRTSRFKIGPNYTKQYTQRPNANSIFTGLYRFADNPSEWDMPCYLYISQSEPLPLTVLSVIPKLETQER